MVSIDIEKVQQKFNTFGHTDCTSFLKLFF